VPSVRRLGNRQKQANSTVSGLYRSAARSQPAWCSSPSSLSSSVLACSLSGCVGAADAGAGLTAPAGATASGVACVCTEEPNRSRLSSWDCQHHQREAADHLRLQHHHDHIISTPTSLRKHLVGMPLKSTDTPVKKWLSHQTIPYKSSPLLLATLPVADTSSRSTGNSSLCVTNVTILSTGPPCECGARCAA